MDDRSAGAPEAVPNEEVVLGARIFVVGSERPAARGEQAIADDARVHRGEWIVLVEDENPVIGVVLGDVRSRDPMIALDATERVRGRARLGMAEGIAARALDRLPHLVGAFDLAGAARAKVIEESALEQHAVRDPDDLLSRHRVHRTELLGDPVMHLRGRNEVAGGRRHGEDALGRRARVGRERGDPLFKLGDRRSCLRFHAARRAFAATAYISTYFLADAVHEWSSRIARARSWSHGSPSALYRWSARPIASEHAAASYFLNE